MDKIIYELLKEVDSQVEQVDINEWEVIANIFQEVIKRKGLTKEQVEELNKRLLKEVREDKEINTYKVADKDKVRKAMQECSEKYHETLKNLADM